MWRFLIFAVFYTQVFSQYVVPEVKLEAFTPRGFRASIPNSFGIKLFSFYGNINNEIGPTEIGDFSGDVKSNSGSYFIFVDPNLELHVGDTVSYRVFVKYNRLGYHKKNLSWNVTELIKEGPIPTCEESLTVVGNANGKKICKGDVIFEDHFEHLNTNEWTIEKFIPFNRPNYEFNYYDPSTVKIENSKLSIKPVVTRRDGDTRREINLRDGCTSSDEDECAFSHYSTSSVPPVMSGKLTSKFKFKYGKIEIRAKLPSGDWIFPEISLIPVDKSNLARLWIAYARGNEDLHGSADGINIGGSLLYGGPVPSYEEPERSSLLRKISSSVPYSRAMHTYTLIWTPDKIKMFVDDIEYGRISIKSNKNNLPSFINGPFNSECELVIGVGVGGINDFPDNYMSGTVKKPWVNKGRLEIRDFGENRNIWLQTWNDNALQVEYVKITAI